MWRGGVKSFVDDLVLGRGVVISRAATSLRSVETQPLTRRFVRSQTSNISAMVISIGILRSPGRHHPFSLTEAEKGCEALGSRLRTQTAVYRSNDRVDSCCLHIVQPPTSPSRAWWVVDFKCLLSSAWVLTPARGRVRPTGSIPVACKPSYGTVRTLLWNKWVNGTLTHASRAHALKVHHPARFPAWAQACQFEKIILSPKVEKNFLSPRVEKNYFLLSLAPGR